jgi:foldase protein PrsA
MLTWLRKKMKTIMIVVATLFAASMFYGLGYQGLKGEGGRERSKGLAKINGREIDALRFREITNRVLQGFGEKVGPSEMAFVENLALGQAVEFTLLLGEANKRVKVSGKEIDATIESIMKQQKVPSKRELDRALKRIGLSLEKFRDLVGDDIRVQKLSAKMQQEVRLLPDDLREIRARHILVTTETEAARLLAKIKSGADFAALAKTYSQDPGSAPKGGDLGYFSSGAMVETFEKAAFPLKVGAVSGIVKSPYGYHIIKATDSRLRKFAGKESEIEKTALNDKQEKTFRRWFSEIKNQARVEITSPTLAAHDLRFKGRPQEAIAKYQQALLENPASALLRVYLGDTFTMIGQKALALSEYEQAVKLEGADPELYIILGKAYDGLQQKDLAATQYRKASLVAGDNKTVHQRLLKLFQELKRPQAVAFEKEELKRIDKKEKFEKELKQGQ